MYLAATAGERRESGVMAPNPLSRFHPDAPWRRIEELMDLLYAAAADRPGGLSQLRAQMFRLIAKLPSEPAALRPCASPSEGPSAAPLSPREHEVLCLMSCGLPNKQIGRELRITSETVKKHAGSLFMKLAVRTRAHAVSRAASLGLL